MLAEKFFLMLETLRSNAPDDRALHIVSTSSPHIAIDLPQARSGQDEPRRGSQRASG